MMAAGERPAWPAYFMAMAMIAATRSTCLRRQVGAVLVRDSRIIATGYNGAPSGTRHCTEVGCLRQELGIPSGERHEICRGSHAEMNAIAQAAMSGTIVRGSTIYCTHEPCSLCSKLLINAGCERAVYMRPYPDQLSRELRDEAGMISEPYDDERAVLDVLERAIGGAL